MQVNSGRTRKSAGQISTCTEAHGEFVYREPQNAEKHYCSPPALAKVARGFGTEQATSGANWHDIWKCAGCGVLWQVYGRGGNHWHRLGPWATWKAMRKLLS